MKTLLLPFFFITLVTCIPLHPTEFLPKEAGDTKLMLDAMVQLMTGSHEGFDPVFFADLEDCMQLIDVQLPIVQDAAWGGMVGYSDSNGRPGDTWGNKSTNWREYNATTQEFHNMTFYEPCNYVSNVAYYHVATQICKHRELFEMSQDYVKGLVQGFVTLAMGSSFMHGSHTSLGSAADSRVIDVVAYLAHQVAVANLPTNSSVIKELSLVPRNKTGLQETQDLMNMFTDKPIAEWENQFRTLDMPEFFMSFAGLLSTIILLRFDHVTSDLLIFGFMNILDVPEEEKEFITHFFLPEIKNATAHIELTEEGKQELEGNIFSFVIKILYAFVWQEKFLITDPIIFNPILNVIGNTLIKYVNEYANSLNTFPVYDQPMQDGEDGVYPASKRCNQQEPHSKWHLESANGLLDLVYLADYVQKITKV